MQVSKILKGHFPHAKIHQFGSTANSLSICGNNDIDVCLEIFEPENDQVSSFQDLACLLEVDLALKTLLQRANKSRSEQVTLMAKSMSLAKLDLAVLVLSICLHTGLQGAYHRANWESHDSGSDGKHHHAAQRSCASCQICCPRNCHQGIFCLQLRETQLLPCFSAKPHHLHISELRKYIGSTLTQLSGGLEEPYLPLRLLSVLNESIVQSVWMTSAGGCGCQQHAGHLKYKAAQRLCKGGPSPQEADLHCKALG